MSVLTGVLLPPDTTANRPSAAGLPEGTLFPSTDDLIIYQVESAAWVVWADYSTAGGGGVDHLSKSGSTPLTGDVTLSEGSGVALTQVGQNIAVAATGSFDANLLPWLIDINVYPTAATNTNWDTINQSSIILYAADKRSSGAQNDLIGWDVVLAAGTWALEITMSSDVGRGIYTVKLDATTAGTIDGYNATTLNPTRRSLTGITVGTTAKYRLTLTMATKNASASAYFGIIYAVRLMRTA